MNLKLGGTLEIGDLVLVSYGHGMDLGLFAGYGRGTIQYYTCDGIIYNYQGAKSRNEKPKSSRTGRKFTHRLTRGDQD
jgi:hypothetical protein